METIDYGDLIERPHNIYDICIGTLSGDPLQRYIYKSFFKTKLIAKRTNLIAKTTNYIKKPYNSYRHDFKQLKIVRKRTNRK